MGSLQPKFIKKGVQQLKVDEGSLLKTGLWTPSGHIPYSFGIYALQLWDFTIHSLKKLLSLHDQP